MGHKFIDYSENHWHLHIIIPTLKSGYFTDSLKLFYEFKTEIMPTITNYYHLSYSPTICDYMSENTGVQNFRFLLLKSCENRQMLFHQS